MKYDAALVLEGGGMRGAYTQAVLDVFIEHDIDFSYIVGISVGSGNAMSFMSKQKGRTFDLSLNYSHSMVGLKQLFKHGSYFNLDRLFNELDKELFFDYDAFKQNDSQFYVGAFNVETGKVDYFDKASIEKSNDPAIASSSLPILNKMKRIGDNKYFDGGLVDAIPLNKAIEDGNEKIVVVLTNPLEYVRKPESSLKLIKIIYRKYPKLIEAVANRHIGYNALLDKLNEMERNKEIFVIRPDDFLPVSRYTTDQEKLVATYEQGIHDTESKIADLIKYLNGDL